MAWFMPPSFSTRRAPPGACCMSFLASAVSRLKVTSSADPPRFMTALRFQPTTSIDGGLPAELGVQRAVLPAHGIRAVNKSRMVHNAATPHIEVDPETYEVRADGALLTCAPATVLPLAQRYFLY